MVYSSQIKYISQTEGFIYNGNIIIKYDLV